MRPAQGGLRFRSTRILQIRDWACGRRFWETALQGVQRILGWSCAEYNTRKSGTPDRQFKVSDNIRVNLHHGKIEDAVVRAVIQDADGTKLQVDVVGLDLTAFIDTPQVVE